MNKKYTAAFCTLGCRVNRYETRAVEESFEKEGFEIRPFGEECDVYVINTCTVTGESDRKSRQMIGRALKNGKGRAIIAVMGCMSQAEPQKTAKIQGVDIVLGNGEKLRCVMLVKELMEQKEKKSVCAVSDIYGYCEIEKMSVFGSDNTRAFLKVVDGCENRCSYCIIPSVRGKVRSKPIDEVYDECRKITDVGNCREIVLTGIETAAYGRDVGTNLGALVKRVAQNPMVKRIRLGSLEPTVLKEPLVKELSELKVFMPHFHLSLQSGSDSVLARMRRKYNTEMFYDTLLLLRKYFPGCEITTDIIVGFPGETEQEFLQTCEFVKKCGFLYAHIFPYSDRNGTAASKMENKLQKDTKQQRAAELFDVMVETRRSVLEKYVGCEMTVLCETVKNGYTHGYTENYIEVRIKNTGLCPNDIVKVRIAEISDDAEYVKGELVTEVC